jgi:hypothetical protein
MWCTEAVGRAWRAIAGFLVAALIGIGLADLGVLPSRLWAVLFAAVVEVLTQWDHIRLLQQADEPANGFDGLTNRQVQDAKRIVQQGGTVTDPALAPAVVELTGRDTRTPWWTWVLFGYVVIAAAVAVWAYLYSDEVALALLWAGFLVYLLLTPLRRARRAAARASAEQVLATP